MVKKIIIYILILSLHGSCKDSEQVNFNSNFSRIDLFNVIYKKPLSSLEIDSTGRIIEFIKSEKDTRVYQYNLTSKELDSLNKYLALIYQFKKIAHNNNVSCVDGVSYNLMISNKHKKIDLSNTICYDKTPIDELVLFILNVTQNKEKSQLFKNQYKYEEMIKEAYLILKLDDVE